MLLTDNLKKSCRGGARQELRAMEKQWIYFNSRDKLIRINIRNIVYFESDGNYTYMITTNKHKSCLSMNLSHTESALAQQLDVTARQFMRVGKRFIINMKYIYQIDTQKQALLLSDWYNFLFQLPVSKESLRAMKRIITNK